MVEEDDNCSLSVTSRNVDLASRTTLRFGRKYLGMTFRLSRLSRKFAISIELDKYLASWLPAIGSRACWFGASFSCSVKSRLLWAEDIESALCSGSSEAGTASG